jgi:hypothetical protein
MNIVITSPAIITFDNWPESVPFTHHTNQASIEERFKSGPSIDVLIVVTTFLVKEYDCISVLECAIELDPVPLVLLVRTANHESSLAFICEVRQRFLSVEVAVAALFESLQPDEPQDPSAGQDGKKARGGTLSPRWSAIADIAVAMGEGHPAPRDALSYSHNVTSLFQGFQSLSQMHKRALVRAADVRTVPRTNKEMAKAFRVAERSYNNVVRKIFSTLGIEKTLRGPMALVDVAYPLREWLLSYGERMKWYPVED